MPPPAENPSFDRKIGMPLQHVRAIFGQSSLMKLSVVLITRNQEWNVARLIRSVMDVARALDVEYEIALVDSASKDETVAAAAQFPIEVLALAPDQRLTAAAGRYVGFINTTGEYVLFLDGDMELIEGWLQNAMDVLNRDSSIAVVGGRLVDRPKDAANGGQLLERPLTVPVALADVTHAGGGALYRRSVLDEVGSFNAFIYSDEEPELCIRIRYRGGYRVVRLDCPMAYHYSDPDDRFLTLINRARRNLYVGAGQNLRMLLGSDLLIPYVRERGHGLLPGLWLTVGIGMIFLFALAGYGAGFGAWLLATVIAVAVDAIRKRSVRGALHSVLKRCVASVGTARGFLMRPEKPDDYPARLTPVP